MQSTQSSPDTPDSNATSPRQRHFLLPRRISSRSLKGDSAKLSRQHRKRRATSIDPNQEEEDLHDPEHTHNEIIDNVIPSNIKSSLVANQQARELSSSSNVINDNEFCCSTPPKTPVPADNILHDTIQQGRKEIFTDSEQRYTQNHSELKSLHSEFPSSQSLVKMHHQSGDVRVRDMEGDNALYEEIKLYKNASYPPDQTHFDSQYRRPKNGTLINDDIFLPREIELEMDPDCGVPQHDFDRLKIQDNGDDSLGSAGDPDEEYDSFFLATPSDISASCHTGPNKKQNIGNRKCDTVSNEVASRRRNVPSIEEISTDLSSFVSLQDTTPKEITITSFSTISSGTQHDDQSSTWRNDEET